MADYDDTLARRSTWNAEVRAGTPRALPAARGRRWTSWQQGSLRWARRARRCAPLTGRLAARARRTRG
jgi:hypothetical protein